jgi:hypothetical protein
MNELDRGWQKIIDFNVGDKVKFNVPYFESKFEYQGVVLEIKKTHVVVKYYESLNDTHLITHVDLLDKHGYRKLTKVN